MIKIDNEQLALAVKGGLPLVQNTKILQKTIWAANDVDGMLCLINQLANSDKKAYSNKLVFLGPIECLPVLLQPARYFIEQAPIGTIGAIPLLEDWGVAHRCFSERFVAGAFEGNLAELLKLFTKHQDYAHFSTAKQSFIENIK